MKRTAIISTIAGALLLTIATPAFASHVQDVLGVQTAANEINFPPVTAGAGAILPDSPFYAVDKAFQSLKLALSLTPEKRAQTRNMVIGERLAELRVMTQRNNTPAIQNVLNDITIQSEKMASELADAAAQGRNVSTIAQNINNTLRVNRDILGSVSEQANGPLALQVKSVSQALLAAKVKVEENLPEQQMLEAMNSDLEDEVDTQVLGVETSTTNLEKRLEQLDSLASRAEKSGANKVAIEELKKKRQELSEQIKTNTQNTKAAIKQLKETRKDTKKAIRSLQPSITCVESNFKNHGQYVSCVARQKLGGQKVREAAQSNKGKVMPSGTVTPSVALSPSSAQ